MTPSCHRLRSLVILHARSTQHGLKTFQYQKTIFTVFNFKTKRHGHIKEKTMNIHMKQIVR